MGTSGSSKGPNSKSPLVPPWADSDPTKPLPTPERQRFRGFRTDFGRAAGGGDGGGKHALRSALGKYARDATGGSSIGPRRLGPAYASGSALLQTLAEMGAGGTGENSTGVNFSGLVGQPIDVAAQEIARALAPENADADKISAAIQEALAEAMPEVEIFDPGQISQDQLVHILVEFFTRMLFLEISSAAGDAWNKSPNAAQTTQTEADLFELIYVVVDKHLSPRLAAGVQNLSRAEITKIQRDALGDVWREWESYE